MTPTSDQGFDLFAGGPDVLQVDRLAMRIGPERIHGQVAQHRSDQRVGDAQGRRRQVARLHLAVNAALEIPVARQHGGHGQILARDHLGNLFGQRAGIADAGGAAITHQIETQLLEVRREARLVEVLGDDARARRQRGLHPGPALQTRLHRLAGQQAGRDHDGRVRRVGATRDRGDDDRAMGHRCGCAGLFERSGGASDTSPRSAAFGHEPGNVLGAHVGCCPREHGLKDCLTPARATRSCGRLGPATLGSTLLRSRSSTSLKRGSASVSVLNSPCYSCVALDQVDDGAAPGQVQVLQGVRVDREQRGGGAELG
jgi:hypothetical protein